MSFARITSVITCSRRAGEPFASIEIRLNQQGTFPFYVDTARLVTAISPRVQQMLGLHITRRRIRIRDNEILGVDRAVLESLVVQGFPETEVAPLTVYVTPLPFVDGRIGMNYLSQFTRVCYDFAAENLLLTR